MSNQETGDAGSGKHQHPPPPPETPGRGPKVEVVLADGPPIDLDAWARKYARLLLEELEEEERRMEPGE